MERIADARAAAGLVAPRLGRGAVELARRQSVVTHAHLRSQLCCALYCLWARRIVEGSADPWLAAVETLRAMLPEGRAWSGRSWRAASGPMTRPTGGGSGGHAVDALRSARQVVELGDYEAVVKAAVALGNDTDTTACIAGGIAGLRGGSSRSRAGGGRGCGADAGPAVAGRAD